MVFNRVGGLRKTKNFSVDLTTSDQPEQPQDEEMEIDPPKSRSIKLRGLAVKRCITCETVITHCTCAPEDAARLRRQWPCVDDTLQDKKFRAYQKALSDVWEFIQEKLPVPLENVPAEDWMLTIIKWGEIRGRTEYIDGSMGPAPQSAQTFFNLFRTVVKKHLCLDLIELHPILQKFPKKWMRTICRDKLYSRQQAQYFTREDVRAYVKMFRAHNGTDNQNYYARMAEVIILISVLFAGCRLGELLSITIGQVKFMTTKDKVAVTMSPGGSKTDFASQRTTCIAFSELPDEELCPVKAFAKWLHFRGLKVENAKIVGPYTKKLFPAYETNNILETSLFTKKVQGMEKRGQQRLPKFNAHTGRVTITTLALFAKDEQGQPLIAPELIEHQLHWQRGTQVLSNYLGHNATFAEGSFHSHMSNMRSNNFEGKMGEKLVKDFTTGNIDQAQVEKVFTTPFAET